MWRGNPQRRRRIVLAAAAATTATLASVTLWPARADGATVTWNGNANDNNFNTGGNWDTNAAPGAADDAVFAAPATSAGNLTANLNGGTAYSIGSLTLNAGLNGPVTINTTNTNRLTINGRTGDDIVVNGGSHVIAETDGNISPNVGLRQGPNFSYNVAAGATLEISARINSTNSNNTVAKNGLGTVILSAANGGTTGWNVTGSLGVSVAAGTLVLKNDLATGNSANKFTVNSGATLELQSNYGSGNAALTLNDGSILRSSNGNHSVSNGTGTIALTGNTTVDVVDGNLTFAQDLSGSANFTKTGTGTLTIGASDNSYTGNTIISAGTVVIGTGSSIATSRGINVLAGATLDASLTNLSLASASNQVLGGSGTVIGNVTTNANTTLSPGSAKTAGTLTHSGNLTFNGGTLQLDLANTTTLGGAVNDLLAVSGALSATGSTLLSINRLNGALAAGTYTLATFGGAFSGSVGNLVLPTVRQSLTLVDPNTNAGKLDLIVGAGGSANLVWAGNGTTNVWKTNDSVNNFLNGASPDKFFDWDDVTFTDAGSNSPNVNIQGVIQPSTVTVNNATKNYTFAGNGTMIGVNNLVKSGTGALTIANADGNVISQADVNAGTLSITNGSNIATLNANNGGKVVLANASANAGNISVANANNGGQIVFGNGTTPHSVGSLNVNSGGTLTFANTVASTIGTLNILPGATVNVGDGVTPGVGNAGASISNNQGTVNYNRPDDFTSTTVIGGSGTVQKLGSGVVTVTATNTYTGPTLITAGVLKVNNNAALGPLPGGSVTITDGGSLDVGAFAAADTANFGQKLFLISGNGIPSLGIGALTNTSTTLRQLNAFQKVTLTADATVGGPGRIEVRAPSAAPNTAVLDLAGHTLTKIGTNTFGIARADTTAGNIHVTAGTLNIEGSTNIPAGGTMTFDTGATGQFNSLTGNVARDIVLNGGTIGDTSTSGSTSVPSNISLAANSNINVNSTGGLTLPGVISGGAGFGFNKTGVGTLTIPGNNTYSGVTSVNNGVLLAGSSANLGNASATNNLAFGGTGGTLRATASFSSPGRTVAVNAPGVIDTNGSDVAVGAVDGTASFMKTGGGKLTVGAHVISGNLTVDNGVLAMTADTGPAGASHVAVLAITGGATQINLATNKLITTSAVGTATGVTYDGVTGLVQSGRNGGAWNGSGIVTSSATGSFTSIGVATGQQVKGLATGSDTAVWSGQTVSGSDTLVMYTYGGDANLDGKINVDDYGHIDSNVVLPGVSGWFNGDFNYDGKINVDDYGIIDSNVPIQGAPFPTGSGAGLDGGLNGVSAVPEPASLVSLFAACGVASMKRRRRRS
jgi:fibronectin-binding autotransporter adhesin